MIHIKEYRKYDSFLLNYYTNVTFLKHLSSIFVYGHAVSLFPLLNAVCPHDLTLILKFKMLPLVYIQTTIAFRQSAYFVSIIKSCQTGASQGEC